MFGVALTAFIIAMLLRHVALQGEGSRPALPWRPRSPTDLPIGFEKARPSRIADIEPGELVAVYGTVSGDPTLESPVRRRDCVAYDLVVYRVDTHERLARSLRAEPFTIRDASGSVLVDPRGAYIRLDLDPTTSAEMQRARDAGHLPDDVAFEDLECFEGVLLRGWWVLVVGVVGSSEDVEQGAYRSAPGDPALRLECRGGHVAVITTYDSDRKVFGGAL